MDIVTDEATFKVHKALLKNVPFFATRFKDCWDSQAELISFEGEYDAATLDAFVTWIYTGKVNLQLMKKDEKITSEDRLVPLVLAKCYSFGDQMMCTGFKNATVDCLVRTHKEQLWACPMWVLPIVMEYDFPNNHLLQFLLDSAVQLFMTRKPRENQRSVNLDGFEEYPNLGIKFIEMIEKYRNKPWDDPLNVKDCTYHDHTDGSECKKELAG